MFIRGWQVCLAGSALSLPLSTTLQAAKVQRPSCPFVKPTNPLQQIHLQHTIVLPKEVLRATALTARSEIKIEIQTKADGTLSCATPLTFASSLFLPYAMSAIESALAEKTIPPVESPLLIVLPDPRPLPSPRDSHRVLVFPDPYHPPPETLRDPELEKLTCNSQNVDELVDVVRQLGRELSAENIRKQIQCMSAAMMLEPDSFALQFLGSRVYLVARTSREIASNERQEFLVKSLALARSALTLNPQSVDAQNQLRAALRVLDKIDEEEKLARELTSANNPPEAQKRAYTALVGIYDEKDDRHKALIASSKAEQIQETIDALEATNSDELRFSSLAMIGREDLAARKEEAGEYAQAASDYEAAHNFAKPGLYYDGVFFKIDMGIARSLRQSEQTRDADRLCNRWQHKAQGKIHIFGSPDSGGGTMDWGGRDVASATWEYSCGDFNKGVQSLIRISESRFHNPSDKWGEGTRGTYLRAPLESLESAFLSRGQSQLARQTRAILGIAWTFDSRDQLSAALKRLEELKESLGTMAH